MAEATANWMQYLKPPGFSRAPGQVTPDNRFTQEALERHKREGLDLAVRVRIWAMTAIGIFILFITPWPAVLFYEGAVILFILIGLAQRHVGRTGHNPAELRLLFADLALMTVVCLAPNPLDDRTLPLAFQYRFETFLYFFTILAGATLAYSWQTIVAVGSWTAALWAMGLAVVWYLSGDGGGLRADAQARFPDQPTLAEFMDPTALIVELRVQEIVVFLIVAGILAVSMRRLQNLVLEQAEAERGRANLSRYFSPNVVESLSHSDEPLQEVRTQDVAVLFVDIVGFTAYSADRPPERVISTLRDFHARMETAVFDHGGTLDKYLGDGLMATFGTPFTGPRDASNAVACARAMMTAVDDLNRQREAAGRVTLRASFGLHYGAVVLGDIGASRLEFAVIGNTVNIASRLEAMTRQLDVRLIASDAVIDRLTQEQPDDAPGQDLTPAGPHEVRGLHAPIRIWTLS
ncbi:MAG: adenylate/guanylate cyclase domain-containing protein [Pseudomonadota bacterium]